MQIVTRNGFCYTIYPLIFVYLLFGLLYYCWLYGYRYLPNYDSRVCGAVALTGQRTYMLFTYQTDKLAGDDHALVMYPGPCKLAGDMKAIDFVTSVNSNMERSEAEKFAAKIDATMVKLLKQKQKGKKK